MQVGRLDHLVLTVKDINTTCDFYTKVLGMEDVTFACQQEAPTFGSQKIDLNEDGDEFDPKSEKVYAWLCPSMFYNPGATFGSHPTPLIVWCRHFRGSSK